ncbi:MAG: hypothetical protein RBR29_01790 [Castellaniella sp.]|uniref:hypothetical protein n=1 Tax=Castellaniella sp. TaxID=1955812 RepID=UPI002A366B79|nr:hypothetical protein [Castellaniella sp.]MDY0308512.1 hypothetical protein [Castellaniella sp.]
MKTDHECTRRAVGLASALMAVGVAVQAQEVMSPAVAQAREPAQASPAFEDPQTRWETQSVRELMQQDLRDALQVPPGGAARRADADSGMNGVRPVLEPRLVALYGVGRALMAEVQVGRRAYLYVRGQAWPAGHAGDRGVYQLRGMNGACVQLERGDDRHSLCLRMLLGEARP